MRKAKPQKNILFQKKTEPDNSIRLTKSPLKILWSSNAAWAHSGYGVQTGLFAKRLKQAGHDVAVHAWCGLEAGIVEIDGIKHYPKGAAHLYGQDNVGINCQHHQADVCITLIDAWVCDVKNVPQNVAWCPWFPVDSEPIPPAVLAKVKESFCPLNFSKHGMNECEKAGVDSLYVPHGVDTNVFKPMDRREARDKLGWMQDKFIVGMVAANNGFPARKAFPECFQAFAEFQKIHTESLLYVHSFVPGANGGINLQELADQCGITSFTAFPEQYGYTIGYTDEHLRTLYSAMDVLLNPAYGEGFGVPILEAQACGTRVIVGDWTAMSELCFAGTVIFRDRATKTPTQQKTFQYVPHVDAIVEALERIYEQYPWDVSETAVKCAREYDADKVTNEYWIPALEEISRRIDVARRVQNRYQLLVQPPPVPEPREEKKVSIITPWRDHPEFIQAYELAVQGAEVIVIDNNSTPENSKLIEAMVNRLGGQYFRYEENLPFGIACNTGLHYSHGDVVVMLNNDITSSAAWIGQFSSLVMDDRLYGASAQAQVVDGVVIPYIEGWCLAATRSTWDKLGGFDTSYYEGNYWEDTDLNFRAMQQGMTLHPIQLPLQHIGNGTAKTQSGAYEHSMKNRLKWVQRVREGLKA